MSGEVGAILYLVGLFCRILDVGRSGHHPFSAFNRISRLCVGFLSVDPDLGVSHGEGVTSKKVRVCARPMLLASLRLSRTHKRFV